MCEDEEATTHLRGLRCKTGRSLRPRIGQPCGAHRLCLRGGGACGPRAEEAVRSATTRAGTAWRARAGRDSSSAFVLHSPRCTLSPAAPLEGARQRHVPTPTALTACLGHRRLAALCSVEDAEQRKLIATRTWSRDSTSRTPPRSRSSAPSALRLSLSLASPTAAPAVRKVSTQDMEESLETCTAGSRRISLVCVAVEDRFAPHLWSHPLQTELVHQLARECPPPHPLPVRRRHLRRLSPVSQALSHLAHCPPSLCRARQHLAYHTDRRSRCRHPIQRKVRRRRRLAHLFCATQPSTSLPARSRCLP